MPFIQKKCGNTKCNNLISRSRYCTEHTLEYKKWSYLINGVIFDTTDAVDKNDQRVWTKPEPINSPTPQVIVNILDKPEAVGWRIKKSHMEIINPDGTIDYLPDIGTAGSCAVNAGTNYFSMENSSALLSFFPISKIGSHTASELNFKVDSNGIISLHIDQPAWVGYGTSNGNLTIMSRTAGSISAFGVTGSETPTGS